MSARQPLPPAVVIGVGNPFRRDDGVGAAVADRLQLLVPPSVARVVVLDGEPTRLLDAWQGAGLAVVVDAVRSGAAPGTIRRIEVGAAAGDIDRAAGRHASTHGAGLGQAIALGRAVGCVPARLVLYTVEGADFGPGPGLSTGVEAAVAAVAAQVRAELPPPP